VKAAKEVLPNPGDMFQSLRYLQDQAARGAFKGHTSAYLVMLYLTMNMWVRAPNNDDAGIGQVMYGRSGVNDIRAGTTLSERAVQYALTWLSEEEWLETERAYTSTGREDKRYIMLMLDHRAHVSRARRREAGEALEKIVREGATSAPREGATSAPT
jgi:hypothetical protein